MSEKQQYDNEMRFVLFPKKKSDNPKSPTWDGTLQIAGKEWKITGWDMESRFGKHFISGSIEDPKEESKPAPAPAPAPSDERW